MLPSSHQIPRNLESAETQGALLAGAFADFIAASARLEVSYRDLQSEVAELSQALLERNRALSESRFENRNLGQRLQTILETIPCGVLVLDIHGGVQMANPEAQRLLALSRGYLATPELRLELVPEEVANFDGELQEQEISFESSEGCVWLAVRRVPLPRVAPSVPGWNETVLTVRDISARKRLERERESARDSVALAQVSALLAHEIRNPLASMELFAGLLEDCPDRRGEWTAHLRAGIRSLSGTVNNVLTLNSSAHFPLERVDAAAEVALAVDFLQPLAQQGGVHLQFEAESNSAHVRANRSALHQILLNLCSNALRHTPPGGLVRVICRASDPPEGTRISVIDNGSGIAPEHLSRLFEVGFSGSGTTSGLGLAVCERLVQQLGGALSVESYPGCGSTFTLELVQA